MNMIVMQNISIFQKKDSLKKLKNGIIASMLRSVEVTEYLSPGEYKIIRKIIMDGLNDFNRGVLRELLGEIEDGSGYKKPTRLGKEVRGITNICLENSVHGDSSTPPEKSEFHISR